MQSDVYTILCFSDMSLPRADTLTDLIVLTSTHERSADYIQRFLKLPFNLQNQGLWQMVKSMSDATDEH